VADSIDDDFAPVSVKTPGRFEVDLQPVKDDNFSELGSCDRSHPAIIIPLSVRCAYELTG
jgi:hypothetical protein